MLGKISQGQQSAQHVPTEIQVPLPSVYVYNLVDDEVGWQSGCDMSDLKMAEWLVDPDFFKNK
jgi:hypothetical protein